MDGILGKDSVMELVSTIINFIIKGDRIFGWYFVIDGRLGKDYYLSSLNNQKYLDNRDRYFLIYGRFGKGNIRSLNNQKCCYQRG